MKIGQSKDASGESVMTRTLAECVSDRDGNYALTFEKASSVDGYDLTNAQTAMKAVNDSLDHNIAEQFTAVNNKLTVQTGTLASGFGWAKFCNVATLNIEWTVTTLNSWVTIGTLPFKPYYSFYTPIWLNNANTYQGLYIDATGLVQIYASGGTKVYGSVTFVCH